MRTARRRLLQADDVGAGQSEQAVGLESLTGVDRGCCTERRDGAGIGHGSEVGRSSACRRRSERHAALRRADRRRWSHTSWPGPRWVRGLRHQDLRAAAPGTWTVRAPAGSSAVGERDPAPGRGARARARRSAPAKRDLLVGVRLLTGSPRADVGPGRLGLLRGPTPPGQALGPPQRRPQQGDDQHGQQHHGHGARRPVVSEARPRPPRPARHRRAARACRPPGTPTRTGRRP